VAKGSAGAWGVGFRYQSEELKVEVFRGLGGFRVRVQVFRVLKFWGYEV
jgi:hypothetical protein